MTAYYAWMTAHREEMMAKLQPENRQFPSFRSWLTFGNERGPSLRRFAYNMAKWIFL
jgi:hypothetical protein